MSMQVGKNAEAMAKNYLVQQGLKFIHQNYRWRGGEIDLIMQDRNRRIIFVEVKYRSRAAYGSAVEAVSITKQRRIFHTAQIFLQQHPEFAAYDLRFDILAVDVIMERPQLTWLHNAFEIPDTW